MIDDEVDDLDVGDIDEAEPSSADTLTRDVEEAVGQQLAEKGHPNPYEGLQGRDDSHPGGRYEGLEEYAATAKANGTSIQAAMRDYVELETKYRENPINGLTYIAQKTGQDPRRLAAAWNHSLNGPGGNQHMANMGRQQEYAHSVSKVAEFERNPANKHFGAVRHEMARLVQERPDLDRLSRANPVAALKQAYQLALKANPRLGIQDRLDKELSRKDRRVRR